MSERIRTWLVVNAEARNAASPETFEIPAKIERTALDRNDKAKLIFQPDHGRPERMWVLVLDRSEGTLGQGPTYAGRVANAPLSKELPKLGDAVVFRCEHIIDIEWRQRRAN